MPGPKARAFIELDQKYVSPSYTRDITCPLVIEKGEGAFVQDIDGNVFLDFCAGIAVNSTGHSHPEVVKAIQQQAKKFLHMSGTDFYYEPQVELAERLIRHMPGKDERKGHQPEGLPRRRPQVPGGLEKALVHARQPGPHHDGDEADAERGVGDDDG